MRAARSCWVGDPARVHDGAAELGRRLAMSIRESVQWPRTSMWSWPAGAESIPAARRAVVGFLEQREAGPYGDVALAVSEAVTNVVQHAYREDGRGVFRLAVERSGEEIVIEVSDDGRGMQPRQRSSGAGLG